MQKVSDKELQARLQKEIHEDSEKKRKLEEGLRKADARSKLLIDSAARKDIEAYKKRFVVLTLSR
jgi:hypothetical protein